MKPFLGIDITTNRKNERLNGNEFLILKPSEILSQTLCEAQTGSSYHYGGGEHQRSGGL